MNDFGAPGCRLVSDGNFKSRGAAFFAALAVLLFSGAQFKADIAPGTCTPGSNGSDAVPQASSPGPFALGERMGYRVLLTNPTLDQFLNPGCTISNAFVNLRLPSGEIIPILTNVVLIPGQQIICPGAPECLSTGRVGLVGAQLFYTNVVTASQLTNVNLTVPQCPPASGTNSAILAFTLGGAIVFNSPGVGVFGTATYNRCSTIPVNVPCIACVKNCSNATGQSGLITFSGFVTNCGNSQLVNVTASNLVGGVLVPITLASNTLNPGAFIPFSGSYANPNICAPVTDTILVRGFDPLLITNQVVTSQCQATCSNVLTACLSVTKNCTTAVAGQPQTISGVVTNCGNVTLTNISVSDNIAGAITNGVTLTPGGSFTYSKTITAVCGGNTNVVTATANTLCGAPVLAQATNICVVTEAPCIAVTKACTTAVVGQSQTISGLVTNCGNVTLTNIVVTDNLAGAITNVASLAPGGSILYSKIITAVCGGNTNIVTASANSICGTRVTASATNTCVVTEAPCAAVTKNCTTVVVGQVQAISGLFTNCGNVTLTNVVITDSVLGVITNFDSVPVGDSRTYGRTFTAVCGGNTNVITATANSICGTPVIAQATNVCVVTEAPCIAVTKDCTTAAVGQAQTISGLVTNCGNVTLTNIVVTDNVAGAITNVASLAPGGSIPYSKTITAVCGGNTNIVTASANSTCGTRVTGSATNVCVVTEAPCIAVTKNCTTAVVGQPQTISGLVTNCGNVTLTNIAVSDDIAGAITNGVTLAPGGSFPYSKTITAVCGGNTNVVTATANSICGTPVLARVTNVCVVTEAPCIAVTKTCTTAVVGQPQTISGLVTNCGNVTLTNIVVTDNVAGAITNVASLAPGGSILYSKVITAVCGGNTNIVTASANSICGTRVTASATNVCVVTEAPCIAVTKTCTTAVVGQPQTISGVVTNCGNVTLTNISVSDNIAGAITNGVTLNPGGSFTYSKTITAVCGGNTNVVTATANSICGTPVLAQATNICVVTEAPCIAVTKTCTTAVVGQPQTISGLVTNCGNVTLTNIVVTDNVAGAITNVASLAPGGSILYSKTITAVCGGNTNIVTASANSICGTRVTASATNACVVTEAPCAAVTKICTTVVAGQIQAITGMFTNCGNVTLTNVVITDSVLGAITNFDSVPVGGVRTYGRTFTAVCGGNTNVITATANSICGTPVIAQATNTCVVTEAPCIAVTKDCTTAVVGQLQTISGLVTNCGNVTLTNIVVTDNVAGAITNVASLAPGGSISYSKTITAVCGGNTNIVTASANSICGTRVTASATNVCVVTEAPCIAVTKTCTTAVVGQPQTISGVVTNCGNVTLTNITVSDNIAGAITNGVTLTPGGSFTYSKTITAVCGGNTNIVTATANSICGTPVLASATNTCVVTEAPCIAVTKTCTTAVVGQPQTISGLVTNCGNVTLTNIVVTDNVAGAITNVASLAPGGSILYSKTITAVCGGNTNIVTASANSICGTRVTASATNVCVVTEAPCIAVTKTCTTVVVGQPQTISGLVTNCGNVTLTNISVSDNIAGAITNGVTLNPGGSFTYSKTITAVCGGNTNIVTATANSICGTPVLAQATNTCVVTEAPCIAVTKTCTTAVVGQPQTISGLVTNCGNVTLTNIVVTDNIAGAITNVASLAPGGSILYSKTITAVCGGNTNIVTASANSICGTRVTASATNACVVTESPCAAVTKICTTVVAGQIQAITGMFTNCGNVMLTNVVITDSVLGAITNFDSVPVGGVRTYGRTFTAVCGGNTNVITATANSICGTPVIARATNTCVVTEAPCIAVTKDCTTAVVGQPQTISGLVTNCGNVTLTNIVVTDNVAGAITNVASLAPGGSILYSKTITAVCGGNTNVVTASANSICGTRVTASATNACVVTEAPCIAVTRNCPTVVDGQTQTISGVVTNCGNVTITNIVVSDSVLGGIVTNATLAPGATFTYSKTFTARCPGNTNSTTVAATSICGTRVTANATNPCIVTCPPRICVTKEIVCVPPNGLCNAASGAYGEVATGVASGTNRTAFCYKIVVNNCGPDALNNVTVTDPDLGGVLVGFPTTLPVNGSVTNYFQKSWGVGAHTNRVTAVGTGVASGITTNATDTAVAIVVPISVTCDLTLFAQFDMDGTTNDNHVLLPENGPVEFHLTVCNTGQATLSVAISGLPCVGNEVPTTVILAPQQCTNIVCSADVTNCPASADFTVTVVGTAVASTNVPCVLDANGRAITTAPSQCSATVECEQPVSCRVTGGGELNFGVVDRSCIDVETTLFPESVNGLELSHVTHGGQLGAPFSQMDCGAILGNPCIRGEWQHTRHYKGKGNPRDVIDMNFHSVNPKGQFDSLSCACLGCCVNEGFEAGFTGPLHPNQKFHLCNPDDHKVCGPQPRPAPANAIIFSGIATMKPESDVGGQGASNKAAEYVVFRVYIEDRSEPGGHHPGGAVEPSDIYCFQAWKTGIKVSKKPDFSEVAAAFRTALGQANCDFLDALSNGTIPVGTLPSPTVNRVTADIQDCGPLDRGNHQIHPSTGATCD